MANAEAEPAPTPWWKTAAAGSVAAGCLIGAAVWSRWLPLTVGLLATAAVFVFLLARNPEHWLRRLAAAAFTAAGASAVLPDFSVWFSTPGLTGVVSKGGEMSVLFLGAAGLFSIIEVIRTRPRPATKARHRQSVDGGAAVAFGAIGEGANVNVTVASNGGVIHQQHAPGSGEQGPPSQTDHDLEVKLALKDLQTKRFREAGGILANTERFHFEELQEETKFRLLRGLGVFEVLQMNTKASATMFRRAARQAPSDPRGKACIVRALLSEDRLSDAMAEVRKLVAEYPNDIEIWSNRVDLHDEEDRVEDLARNGPDGALLDDNVLAALAKLALSNGNRALALEYGLKARDAGCQHAANYLTLGNALLDEYDRYGPSVPTPVAETEADIQRLKQAIEYFDTGLANAIGAPWEDPIVTGLLTNKADALTFLGDPNVGDWLRHAHETLPHSPEIKRGYALWLANRGAVDEAVDLLRAVVDTTASPQALYELGVQLARREDQRSLEDAATAALQVLAEPKDKVEPWLRPAALRLAVTTMLDLSEVQRAEELLSSATAEMPDEVLFLQVDVARATGGAVAEKQAAVEAAETLAGRLSVSDAATLTLRLARLEEFPAANALLSAVAEGDRNERLMRYSVYIAARLGDHDSTLARARVYRERYGFEPDVLHPELDALETDDPSAAADLMANYLREHPDDRLVWLRRSGLGLNHARPDWVTADTEKLPDPEDCNPHHGRAVVHILASSGKPEEALDYAFVLFRSRFESGDARAALVDAVFRFDNRPELSHPDAVAVDCAVTLEADHGLEFKVVIESAQNPVEFRGEYAPDSELARTLLGKHVGDTVTLPSC